jgi:hypothetical protein
MGEAPGRFAVEGDPMATREGLAAGAGAAGRGYWLAWAATLLFFAGFYTL